MAKDLIKHDMCSVLKIKLNMCMCVFLEILPTSTNPYELFHQCSSTCGEGVETRLWECQGGAGNEVTYDCGPRPHQVRVCTRPACPAPSCTQDTSPFCQLKVLHRYCQIPKYRELCCHTCANVVY